MEDAATASGNTFFIENKKATSNGKIRTKGTNLDVNLEMVPNSWSGTPTQWTMVDAGSGYFYLQNKVNNMRMRPVDTADGSPIIQVPQTNSGKYVQWKKVPASNGYFYLENRKTGMYIRPEGDTKYSKIVQRPTSYSGDWTQWKFLDINTGAEVNNISLPLTKRLSSDVKELKIYPNPVNEGQQMRIELGADAGVAQITIFDLQGRRLHTTTTENTYLDLSVKGFAKGVYLVRADTENGIFTQKMLVQ